MKRKIWLPLLTVGATAAAVVPVLTSCRPGLMGTHDMLNPDYIHHVTPASAREIWGTAAIDTLIPEYIKEVRNNTDVLKDDILFMYSKLLTNSTLSSKLDFTLSRYFLYIDDIEVDKDTQTLKFKLWAEITGKVKDDKIASHKTINYYPASYLRNFNIVIGSTINASFEISEHGQKDPSAGAFASLFRFSFKLLNDEYTRIRTTVYGNIGTSASSASTDTITQYDVSMDDTTLLSSLTDASKLFLDLVYSIPDVCLYGNTPSYTNTFDVISYYFKNVQYHIK